MRTLAALTRIAGLSLVVSSLIAAVSNEAAAQTVTSPTPDTAEIVLHVAPIQTNSFGTELAELCGQLEDLNVPASSATPPLTLSEALDQATRKQTDAGYMRIAESLSSAFSRLKAPCKKLRDPLQWIQLKNADIEAVRAFHGAGSLSSITDQLEGARERLMGADQTAFVAELAKSIKQGSANPSFGGFLGGTVFSNLSSTIANGLADFLVTRSKQEAILFFQEQMKDNLCADWRRSLLDNTCSTIETLDASTSLHTMGTYINRAARKDIIALPGASLGLLTEKDPQNHYLYESGRVFAALGQKLAESGHANPVAVISAIHSINNRKCEDAKPQTLDQPGKWCKDIFKVLRRGSALFHAAAQQKDLESFLNAGETGPRIIALLLDQENFKGGFQIRIDESDTLQKFRKLMLSVQTIAEGMHDILAIIDALDDENVIAKAETAGARRHHLAQMTLDAALISISASKTVAGLIGDIPEQDAKKIVEWLGVGEIAARTARGAIDQDYAATIGDLMKLLAAFNIHVGTERNASQRSPELMAKVSAFVGKHGPFIVELASAKSSQDVAAALDAAAAPVGSYKVKFERPAIALNAFVGVSVAGEWLLSDRASGSSISFGGFAPIGVHMTWPVGDVKVPLGFMVSAFDLGALTQQRFTQEVESADQTGGESSSSGTSSMSATVGLEQLFSPGLYGTIGFFSKDYRSPLVLGAGFSFVPNLRKVELTDAARSSFDAPVLRMGAFLALDLTLLPLN